MGLITDRIDILIRYYDSQKSFLHRCRLHFLANRYFEAENIFTRVCFQTRGVSLYTKKTLNCLEVKFELHDDNSTDTHVELREAIWIEFHLNSQGKLLVGCLYRSPNKQ